MLVPALQSNALPPARGRRSLRLAGLPDVTAFASGIDCDDNPHHRRFEIDCFYVGDKERLW